VLGIAVPRHSHGLFFDPLLPLIAMSNATQLEASYRDLWRQKQSYAAVFLQTAGVPLDPALFASSVQVPDGVGQSVRLKWYRDQIWALMDVSGGREEAVCGCV
jgi:hypothetical protein